MVLPALFFASAILTNCADIAALPPLFRYAENRGSARIIGQVLSVGTNGNWKTVPYILNDATGGVVAKIRPTDRYTVGDIVEVTGRIAFYTYEGNEILVSSSRLIRHEEPPAPIAADLRQIRDGEVTFKPVSLKGVVIDAFRDEIDLAYVWLLVRDHGVTIPITIQDASMEALDLSELVGCELSASGICIPSYGGRRYGCPNVHVRNFRTDVRLRRPTPGAIESAPLLNPYSRTTGPSSLCRVEGLVLAVWGDQQAIVWTQARQPIEVRFRENESVPRVGDSICAKGFAETDLFFLRLTQAFWKPLPGAGIAPPKTKKLSATQLLSNHLGREGITPRYHGYPICLTGLVKNHPTSLSGKTLLYIESEGYLIPVDISAIGKESEDLLPETRLAVTGICLMEFNESRMIAGFPHIRGCTLIVRSKDDIQILSTPPWWTPLRLMVVIGVLLAVILVIGIWNRALKVLSERRGRELMAEQLNRASADLKVGERTRLAVELHDALSQNLTGVSLQLDAVRRFADEDRGKMARHLDMAMRTLKSCRDELRNCLWDLRNRALEEKDMNEAIRRTASPFVGDAALLIRFNVPRDQISDNTAHALMRIVRELATNAVRHGDAKTIRIAGALENGRLLFSVSDDGCGFDPANHPSVDEGHFGLDGIRDRVSRFDGALEIESVPGRGATIRISMTA